MRITLKVLLMGGLMLALIVTAGIAKPRTDSAPWLGVYTQTVDEKMARAFELPDDYGVVVNKVVKDSPADKAGLVEEDVIVKYNDNPVRSASELSDMVAEGKVGEKVKLVVYRDGDEKKIDLTLGSRDEAGSQEGRNAFLKGQRDYARDMMGKKYPYIGVTLGDLTAQLGDYFGVEEGHGALITGVEEDSPAEEAGLKAGDVIVSIDGNEVGNANEVSQDVSGLEMGDVAEVGIVRDKREMTLKVEVGETSRSSIMGNLRWEPNDNEVFLEAPNLKSLSPGVYRFDRGESGKEFQEQMDELRQELKELKEDLNQLRKDLRGNVRGGAGS